MKNKQKAALRLLAALLALTLLAPLGLTASAADGPDTIYIDSASDFVSFAKSCALDTWSAGKTVILRADISLAGMDYTPVAAFGGTFDGGGHTISDLNLTGSYSPAGLFAVILSGGSVEDLNVAGGRKLRPHRLLQLHRHGAGQRADRRHRGRQPRLRADHQQHI